MKRVVFLLGIFGLLWSNQIFPLHYKGTIKFMGETMVYYSPNPPVEILVYDNNTTPVIRVNRKVVEGLSSMGNKVAKIQYYIQRRKDGGLFIVEITSQGQKLTPAQLDKLRTTICNYYRKYAKKIDLIYIDTISKVGYYLKINNCNSPLKYVVQPAPQPQQTKKEQLPHRTGIGVKPAPISQTSTQSQLPPYSGVQIPPQPTGQTPVSNQPAPQTPPLSQPRVAQPQTSTTQPTATTPTIPSSVTPQLPPQPTQNMNLPPQPTPTGR
ncbi:MAG: hypothetical protein C6I01_01485 [Epsilonproteobacteria bacterium]|nr:hypothetical protein [Campylobacterota bacterium]NPA89344.1 hypothetical protein [Campylobacterota bacterium]